MDLTDTFDQLFDIIQERDLFAPVAILFGNGRIEMLGDLAASLAESNSTLIITGGRGGEAIAQRLTKADYLVADTIPVRAEPTVTLVDNAAARAREHQPDLVVAVGGGSVIDAAKAVAALATNPGSVEDYLEGVGRGFTLEAAPVPMVAIPTTSGTGAEMTKNAVIADYEKGFKKSMRDESMIPTAALLDPTLTHSTPRAVTAAAGMDAMTQLIEPCISAKRQPGPTEIAHLSLQLVRKALPICCDNPEDPDARAAMALASGMSGVCLANSGLALAHGVASGLGGLHPVAHGLICGILLPHTLRFNRDACEPELAVALQHFLNENETTSDTLDRGIAAIESLKQQTGVPDDLKFVGLNEAQLREVAEHSMGSSLSGNPIPMDAEAVYDFLRPLCL